METKNQIQKPDFQIRASQIHAPIQERSFIQKKINYPGSKPKSYGTINKSK